jgi:hypothetical protein
MLSSAVGLSLVDCGSRGSRCRQRITVEVETSEGLESGSSVSEAQWGGSDAYGELGGIRAFERGEAVFVNLPDGQTLFASTAASGHLDWLALAAAHAVGQQMPAENRGKPSYFEKHKLSGKLNPEHYPTLIRFRNIDDTATIDFVRSENLEAVFGSDVRLKRITLQISDEDSSKEIENKLPWLTKSQGNYIDGSSTGRRPYLGRDREWGNSRRRRRFNRRCMTLSRPAVKHMETLSEPTKFDVPHCWVSCRSFVTAPVRS